MRLTSGPITVEIREGMVVEARRIYEDAQAALTDDWPEWVGDVLERIEREASARHQEASNQDQAPANEPKEDA